MELSQTSGACTRRRRKLLLAHVAAQGNECWWCKMSMGPPGTNKPTSASLEHLTRIIEGGEDTVENTRAAHKSCNNERHSKQEASRVVEAWESTAAWAQVEQRT